MAGKRKTLPNHFDVLIKTGSLEEQIDAMKKCIPNAVGDYNKYNAFGFPGITGEFARWLVEYGADINMKDRFGYTPLHHQAMRFQTRGILELYIALGADLEAQSTNNGGPLHGAADHGCAENVRLLIDKGADIHARTNSRNPDGGYTALEFALSRCRGADIAEKIDAVAILIRAGVPVTEKVKEEVKRIGERIEFHRSSFPEERIEVIDDAIQRLYDLTGVTPVARRRLHDGVSPITVIAQTWQKQYQELWGYLVPGMGACQTVQGEVIRISGRVADELLGNGGINWDADYRLMLGCLKEYLEMGVAVNDVCMDEIKTLISSINKSAADEKKLQRLQQLCVEWVLRNPNPLAMKQPKYRR